MTHPAAPMAAKAGVLPLIVRARDLLESVPYAVLALPLRGRGSNGILEFRHHEAR